jgi:peptide/nickel transport system substrate-binding protein
MIKRYLVLLFAVALAAAVLAGCGSSGGGQSSSSESASAEGASTVSSEEASGESSAEGGVASGGKLVVGAASGIPQLNPVLKGTAFEEVLFPLLWDGLTQVNKEGEIAPDLATKWTANNDSTVWTFQLRPGVKFSNGKPLTAEDVVKTLDYYTNPNTATQLVTALEPIKSVKAEGKSKVVFELESPNALLPEVLVPVKIVDMSSLGSINKDPVVTGPFMVKSFAPENHVILVRNPEYFGETAPLEEIELVKSPDSTSAVTALRSGDLDMLWSVPASEVQQIEGDSTLQVIKPAVTGQYVSWEVDTKAAPFNDVRARQALAYSIDREAILKAAYYDQGVVSPTNTPLAENSPSFGGKLTDYSYDPEKAKKLWEEAGVTKLTWWGVAGQYPEWNTSAQILQQSLKEMGVELKIENTELSTWPAKFYPAGKTYPGLIIPNFQSYPASPYFQLSFPLSGRCECNWNNKAYDSAFDEALASSDEGQRQVAWDKAQEQINKEAPLFIPVLSVTETAAQSDVSGAWVEGSGNLNLASAGLSE